MAADLEFACSCGAVKGVCRDAGGRMGIRVVCYCADCQAFAHFLGRAGDYLDAAGGTDIYQTPPSRLEITQGLDRIKQVVVSPGGMQRFYAACCMTPLANTIPARNLPFAGTFVRNYDAACREETLGPPVSAVFVNYAQGEPVTKARIATPFLVLDLMRRAAREWLSGKSRKNVYLDAADEGRIDAPQRLTADERARLDAMAVRT